MILLEGDVPERSCRSMLLCGAPVVDMDGWMDGCNRDDGWTRVLRFINTDQ